ncbi:MAG: exonuclease SbcCD subunit D C-terminal domain-containing protein [Clostridium fessum]
MLTSGGLDAIDASVLEPFEYAALGHIHGAQKVGQERFCYCGTPYKYSISEEHHQKGSRWWNWEKRSEPQIRRLPILCHPDVKRVRGTLEELKLLSDTMEKMPDGSGRADAYVSVVLTDEKEMYDFRERLKELFAHILEIRVDNERTRKRLEEEPEETGAATPFQAFASFMRRCATAR